MLRIILCFFSHVIHLCIYVYICIYIQWDREIEREREQWYVYVLYNVIYVYTQYGFPFHRTIDPHKKKFAKVKLSRQVFNKVEDEVQAVILSPIS